MFTFRQPYFPSFIEVLAYEAVHSVCVTVWRLGYRYDLNPQHHTCNVWCLMALCSVFRSEMALAFVQSKIKTSHNTLFFTQTRNRLTKFFVACEVYTFAGHRKLFRTISLRAFTTKTNNHRKFNLGFFLYVSVMRIRKFIDLPFQINKNFQNSNRFYNTAVISFTNRTNSSLTYLAFKSYSSSSLS